MTGKGARPRVNTIIKPCVSDSPANPSADPRIRRRYHQSAVRLLPRPAGPVCYSHCGFRRHSGEDDVSRSGVSHSAAQYRKADTAELGTNIVVGDDPAKLGAELSKTLGGNAKRAAIAAVGRPRK
jgi:hypothetical protein